MLRTMNSALPAGVTLDDARDDAPVAITTYGHVIPRSLYTCGGKRCVDIVLSSVLLVALGPLVFAVMLLLRCTLGPDVIFRQERVGLNGQPFTMLKFRTMRKSRRTIQHTFVGPDRRLTHKTSDDPRHTRVGMVLRKTSIDELPQLWNVVRGDMSLVGPRPELVEIVDRLALRNHPRHALKPGITVFQTTRRSEGMHLHECFDDDIPYVTHVSLRTDVRIMWKTVSVLLTSKGF